MRNTFQQFDFPLQRIPNSKKDEAWAAQCCDWVIAQGIGNRTGDIEQKYAILHGNIPDEFYKKVLNPYNASNEKFKRFPATMRNYDLMKGIIRRYVGEYIRNPHDFIVGANNPEVVIVKDGKLRAELAQLVEQKIAAKITESYQQWVNEGNEPQEFNPKDHIDVEAFTKEFNENYIDEISSQGQAILNVIRDITDDTLLYARAYFDFVTFGECYTYSDVVGTDLIKRNISPRDAFPINTDNQFREDDDMFACRRKLTYQQIMDEFGHYMTENQMKFMESYYGKTGPATTADFTYHTYQTYFPEVCGKFSQEDRELFAKNPNMERDRNADLYDVWHVVWRGEIRRAIVTYVNEVGMIAERVEEDDYELNLEAGDLKIEYIYEPQVYESVRIGTRNDAIYPYNARAIAYNRGGKLPYNGINELLPGFDKFSIVDIITPYQVFYNIVAYHREMALAKNKLNVLMIAKSLLGKAPEETIYRMIADGVLYIDDASDQGMLRAQQVRVLQSDIGQYVNQLGQLLLEVKESANEQVDMTSQRYGEIATSAGKGTTEEAIIRGSMGSVILEYMLDCMREKDYARDLDYSKYAWIDGLNTSYRNENHEIKYISLDVNVHSYADYIIKAKNSIKEQDKLRQLQQYAFSAAQNGDNMMAIAAIQGDNVATITQLIKKYQEQKDAHEQQLKQMEQQTAQMLQEFEIQKIQAKGEEDRKTKELEGLIDQQIELIRADANMISYNAEVDESAKEAAIARKEAMANSIDQQKLQLERQKTFAEMFNKAEDRKVKREDIKAKLDIAKMNRNARVAKANKK